MDAILGLIMIYSWIHSFIILKRRVSNTTEVERAIMIVGTVSFVLLVIGVMMG